MTPSPTPAEPDDRAAQREVDAQYYRAMLHELAEMGMDIARSLHRQAAQEHTAQPAQEQVTPEPTPTADPTIAFERIARTIRRTIALARTLDEPARPAPAHDASHQRVAARTRVIRDVEDVIQRKAAEGAEADCLRDELYERLADPGFEADLAAGQPIAEVIQILLRDLGLAATFPGTRPWRRRTPSEVRALRARAARLAGVELPNSPETALPPWVPQPAPTRAATGPPA